MPKLSIITINYNNLSGLKQTLESVVNQTFQDFEYVVIDGGSTDGSCAYLEAHTEALSYWVSEPDTGVYQAMNKGLQQAHGDYVLFLNSGDHFLAPDGLETAQTYLTDFDLVYFNLKVIEASKIYIKTYPSVLSFAYFVKDTLPHPATFIKKSLFDCVGLYREDFKITSDWAFFLDAVCAKQASYKHVDRTLAVFYRDGMSSQTTNASVIFNEKQAVLKTRYAAYLQDLDEVLYYRDLVATLRSSRIISWLVKWGFLNKF